MDQNDQVDGAQLQLDTVQHRLSLNYDADQLKTHIDGKGDDQPPPILFSVALYSVSR
jgi:hypothetical protein